MKAKNAKNLSIDEIHRLIVDKSRALRAARLEQFHRTGRVATLSLDVDSETNVYQRRLVNHLDQAGSLAKNTRRAWIDFSLLGVEVLVILSLFVMIPAGLFVMRNLNQAAASTFLQPTLTPTPLIIAVVLPEGHTPPNSPGGAQPNQAEIPPHLRPQVQSLAILPTPLPTRRQAIRIQVPAIGVDAPVVQGDGWEQLKKGVAQHLGTPNPGENGNIVLAGHNDVFGEIFRDLDRLKPGDVVILFTSQRQYTYVITGTQIVEPTQVEVMNPTPNPTLTLISCHPYLIDTHRIVVSAVLQNQ